MKIHWMLFVLLSAIQFRALAQTSKSNSPLGKTDFHAYLEAAPGLPNSIEEAAKRTYGANVLQPDVLALENFFQPFYQKMESAEQFYQAYADEFQAQGALQSETEMHRQAASAANQNPIIQQMGGAEKVAKMSEQEAEAAARAAAAQYIQDPFAASGIQSAGMTALYQKVASDPAYAARFQNMSEKEREAELRKYMANDVVDAKTPQQMQQEHQKFERQMQDRNEVLNAMEVNQMITDLQMKIAAVTQAYGEQIASIDHAKGNHRDIDNEYNQQYRNILEVVMGEAGRTKDPEQVKKLALETATRHRTFASTALKQYQPALNELRSKYKQICAEYDTFLAKNGYKVNGNVNDLFSGTNTELNMVNLELGLLGLARYIADESKHLTSEVAGWEKNYQETKATYQVK